MKNLVIGQYYHHPDFNVKLEYSYDTKNFNFFRIKGNVIKLNKEDIDKLTLVEVEICDE